MMVNREFPTFSMVIEWENAVLSELDRTREMLGELHQQLGEVVERGYPRPEIIILHDKDDVEPRLVEEVVAKVAPLAAWPAEVRIIAAEGLEYVEQKNFGAKQSDSDLIFFLDSDVIPEPGWLAGLLEAFQDPEVQVVGGNTYISPEGFFGKAFALFWFFPMRVEGSGLRRADGFWANNVAFRREIFEAFPFPDMPSFRVQVTALKQELRKQGVGVFLQQGSRVSHPAPNGLRHFVARAICQGSDSVAIRSHSEKGDGSLPGTVKLYVRSLGRSLKNIARHHRDVKLSPVGAVGAFGVAAGYQTLQFAGALVTHARPELIRRRFSI
jgi:hypothetical protein